MGSCKYSYEWFIGCFESYSVMGIITIVWNTS